MKTVLSRVFDVGPLIFAVGFLVPLISQIIQAFGWTPPYGLTPLQSGFLIAVPLGLLTMVRGRWI